LNTRGGPCYPRKKRNQPANLFLDCFVLRGNQIFAQATGQPKFEIFPESETKFFLKVVDAQLVFVKGENGSAESLVLHQGGREMPGKRVK